MWLILARFQRFGVDGKGRLCLHYRYQGKILGVWVHVGGYNTEVYRSFGTRQPGFYYYKYMEDNETCHRLCATSHVC
jgi:hypothetical protein